MPIPAPVAGALISAGSGIISGLFGGSRQSKQNKANMRLAKYQHDLNMDAWRQQNEYNTPSMQMQRYRDAGLNPHMVAGSGTSGNATAPPQYQAPTQEYRNHFPVDALSGAMGQYLDYKLKKTQNDLVQEQIKSSQADTALKELEVATASNEYDERFNHKAGAYVNGKKVGEVTALSKYSQEYTSRALDNKLKALTLKTKQSQHDETFSPQALKQREQEAKMKLKRVGQDIDFNAYRNQLAKIGLTFSSNEWGGLINQIINYAETQYKNYEKKKKKKK